MIFASDSLCRRWAWAGRTGLLLFAVAGATARCASFQPRLDERATFLQRASHQENERLRAELEKLPRATTDKTGQQEPLMR